MSLIFINLLFAIIASSGNAQEITRLPWISAHRGASRIAPENTWAAFSQAIAQGADFIEVDVRTSSDDVQVIMHDASLIRTTGIDAMVKKTSLGELKELSAGKWMGEEFAAQKVLTLDELGAMVSAENRRLNSNVSLYVDCKEINTGEVIRILLRHRLLDSSVFYGSIKTLREVKRFYDKARVIPAYPGKEKIAKIIRRLHPYAFDVAYRDLSEETVAHCHANKIMVFSDLLGKDDVQEAYRNVIALGIELIQTDDVAGVRSVYKEFEQRMK